jgi:hypothetical protein
MFAYWHVDATAPTAHVTSACACRAANANANAITANSERILG